MRRWTLAIVGLVMLLIFALAFAQLYKQLNDLQRMRQKPAATRTP